jgi:NADH-quinone oxidoreductase subunit F
LEPILTTYVREPNSFTLDFYLQHGGYAALRKALAMKPDEVIEIVKKSGLRGRGGAGFPTGMKWQFVDKKSSKPRYIACNADESEPGTFKDHLLMERNPHLLLEGCAIACFAINAHIAYIYIRGEFLHVQRVLERAIEEAYARGFLGRNILGSGFDCDIYIHRGAGAYEAGEETALLESLEGKRAQPRNKPPFPAVVGLYGSPTAVNNVETLANVPLIVLNGDAARARRGTCRGSPRRPHAQGGDSGWVVGPDPAARTARHAGELRRRAKGRVAPGLSRHHRARRHDVHGLDGCEPAALLSPRIVR